MRAIVALMTSSSSHRGATRCSMHFLASGSSGNCMLLRTPTANLLIDFGLPPETFVGLLRAEGIDIKYWREHRAGASRKKSTDLPQPDCDSPHRLTAALLTHTHGDHYMPSALRILKDNHVQLWAHRGHLPELGANSAFRKMHDAGHVNHYDNANFQPVEGIQVTALKLPHDSTATHGFVIEVGIADSQPVRIGYAADMGYFPVEHSEALANCDLLALEFNHDVTMERQSNRHPRQIERVLGQWGHLSNEQGAEALRLILQKSHHVKPHCVALLHLSHDCNRPHLAETAATQVLREFGLGCRILITRHRECAGSVDLLARTVNRVARNAELSAAPRRNVTHSIPDFFGHE
ncbi:MAG: MBL fold metallo-hydrolase [Candidatus Sumerlaeaceae bacterium]|nr:MBL fold metallo-hydrolase [Candidatus Sumerlaeaceae bacterium]